MRRLLSASVLASFLLTSPVSGATVMAETTVVSEPDFGFVRGMNIEWSARHMELLPTAEHVAYHAEIQAELESLYAQYNNDIPLEVLRDWMREKAMEHRNWHQTNAPVDGGAVMQKTIRLRTGEEVSAPPSRRFLRAHVRQVYQQSRMGATVTTNGTTTRPLQTFMSTGTSQRPTAQRISRRTLIEQYKKSLLQRETKGYSMPQ